MKKDSLSGSIKPALILKTIAVGVIITLLLVAVFAVLMYFFEKAFMYATVFATVSVSAGAFAAAFYIAKKLQKKGFL